MIGCCLWRLSIICLPVRGHRTCRMPRSLCLRGGYYASFIVLDKDFSALCLSLKTFQKEHISQKSTISFVVSTLFWVFQILSCGEAFHLGQLDYLVLIHYFSKAIDFFSHNEMARVHKSYSPRSYFMILFLNWSLELTYVLFATGGRLGVGMATKLDLVALFIDLLVLLATSIMNKKEVRAKFSRCTL